MDLIKWVRNNYPSKNIWLYTGYVFENLNNNQMKVAEACDVIVDGPYIKELRDVCHTPFRGSTNQRIIYNTKKAES